MVAQAIVGNAIVNLDEGKSLNVREEINSHSEGNKSDISSKNFKRTSGLACVTGIVSRLLIYFHSLGNSHSF